jgi:hypothetical protein
MLDLAKLADLKRLLVEGTDFFAIYAYFMDNFGENPEMLKLGSELRDPTFVAVLEKIGAQMLENKARIEQPLLLRLPEHKLIHGGFMFGKHFGCVFYFEDLEKGLAVFGSMEGGPSQIARFSLTTLPTGKSFTLN